MQTIEKTLFRFIWKYSKRDQLILLAVTTALFPLLFLTLELPKRIINDAIGAQSASVTLMGYQIGQVQYLWLLCAAFLLAVTAHGLLKMRINTLKGMLSERMLRRLRYDLIARMLRFPKPYFQKTSQGELVAMITGETEPMGGIMGEALTQPVLQAGQMLTILAFLFLQSFWFGLAAIALIPFQAWLIPRLQRQINLMNKDRIRELRQLAAMIGESATGAATLRAHGGWRHRLALVTERLGAVTRIRFQIYQKKFFMKFVNNFITQLTPFFFFSVGGYLVIRGDVSLGALVAALAAYKDLSAPWKELLTYYNQFQDMSLRWETVTERFSPSGTLPEALMSDSPADTPPLKGPIRLEAVSVADADGNLVLEDISLDIPQGALVGIAAPSEEDRMALADVLLREVLPVGGRVTIGGEDLQGMHQAVLARRIGHATSKPVLFRGSFGENAMMALRPAPLVNAGAAGDAQLAEALAAGNSGDPPAADWLDPRRAGVADEAALRDWWIEVIEAIGSDGSMFRKSLDQAIGSGASGSLQQGLVAIRPRVRTAVRKAGLDRYVHPFDPQDYNPGLPVTDNLLFATLRRPMRQQEIVEQTQLFAVIRELGLESGLLALSREVIDVLARIFGPDGSEHPLFRKLGLDAALFERSVRILAVAGPRALETLAEGDKTVLMSLPAVISAEQIGPAFPEALKKRILAERATHRLRLAGALTDLYAPLAPDRIAEGMSVMENALFGKIADGAGGRADELRRIVSRLLEQAGLKRELIGLIHDLPVGLAGSNLPAVFAEPLALMRAVIKRPDILVMEQVLASQDQALRVRVHKRLRRLLPDATLIYIAEGFEDPQRFDVFAEISQGRMRKDALPQSPSDDTAASADLQRKVRALETTELFSGLDRKQLRLLAFGAKWFHAQAGDVIFNQGDDPTDGAYMLLSGTAELVNPKPDGEEVVAAVGAGTIVGELGLIRNVPRALTLRASTDLEALRLGAEEFLAVVENDAATSFKLLQVVASYRK